MTIRILPATEERVETGPVQFGDDWPGIFVRGDNAAWIGMILENAADLAREAEDEIGALNLESLSKMFEGCVVSGAQTQLPTTKHCSYSDRCQREPDACLASLVGEPERCGLQTFNEREKLDELYWELEGVIQDTNNLEFDDVCLNTILRVQAELRKMSKSKSPVARDDEPGLAGE